MQYILTEEEYNELKSKPQKIKHEMQQIINKLCQRVCDSEPIPDAYWVEEGEEPEPWGCKESKDFEWYCDECPVRNICQLPKDWGK